MYFRQHLYKTNIVIHFSSKLINLHVIVHLNRFPV